MTVVSRPIDLIRQAWRIGQMALTAVWAFKLRSFFVVLGVALGIASLTVIVAAVDGAERKATEIVKWFGPDTALVLGGDIQSRAVGQRTLTLSFKDAQKLRESMPGAYLVVPMRGKGDVIVRYRGRSRQVPLIVGTTDGYAEAWNWPLAEGRDFTGEDVQKGAKVGLIGDLVAEDLFGDESPVGHTIFVDQLPVQIVGRLSYRGVSGGGGSNPVDDRIILPITTLTQRFNLNRKYFRALRVKFYAPENMAAHIANLRSLLRHLHNLEPGEPDDFSILTADEILKFLSMFKGGLMLFLGITALVAIIVGGFVLANLFYLSVNERRSEIGLKKSVGAPDWAILMQVLTESVFLSLAGALLGVILGLSLGQLMAQLGVLEIMISWKVFIFSTLAATFMGLVFGLRPARTAAGMPPIEALKGEH
ncbi:MAG: ABC transporter permease [Desulfobacterales bacterium]